MKTILKKVGTICLLAIPVFMTSQVDLTIGLNYAYNPPNNCDNQITGLSVDICNNDPGTSSAFIVGIYLYDPVSTNHWVVASTQLNTLSGNSCTTLSNWNINLNSYCCLPAPGTNYRIGVWVDTANVIAETNENNNISLLSGNIQICSTTGIKELLGQTFMFEEKPNPVQNSGEISFNVLTSGEFDVSIMDLNGRIILPVAHEILDPGLHKIPFSVNSLANGMYFLNVRTKNNVVTKKLVVQK